MQLHFHANQSQFHKNGFALRLDLKHKHKETRKWPSAQSQWFLTYSILPKEQESD